MSVTKLWTVAELTTHVGGRLIGDGSIHIQQVADITVAGDGEITYVEEEKFFPAAQATGASCLIAPKPFVEMLRDSIVEHEFGPTLIEVAKPKLAFALIAELLHPPKHR